MRKSTKGALAGVAAAALLLGGFSTRASWNADATIAGGELGAGALSLDSVQCDKWILDTVKDVTDDIASGDLLLVPGDVLNRRCTITVTVAGTRVSADLALDAPDLTTVDPGDPDDLAKQLDATAYFVTGAGAPLTDGDGHALTSTTLTTAGTQTLYANLKVAFPDDTATNDSQNLSAMLEDITVTLAS